jgi:hypothetical protein
MDRREPKPSTPKCATYHTSSFRTSSLVNGFASRELAEKRVNTSTSLFFLFDHQCHTSAVLPTDHIYLPILSQLLAIYASLVVRHSMFAIAWCKRPDGKRTTWTTSYLWMFIYISYFDYNSRISAYYHVLVFHSCVHNQCISKVPYPPVCMLQRHRHTVVAMFIIK